MNTKLLGWIVLGGVAGSAMLYLGGVIGPSDQAISLRLTDPETSEQAETQPEVTSIASTRPTAPTSETAALSDPAPVSVDAVVAALEAASDSAKEAAPAVEPAAKGEVASEADPEADVAAPPIAAPTSEKATAETNGDNAAPSSAPAAEASTAALSNDPAPDPENGEISKEADPAMSLGQTASGQPAPEQTVTEQNSAEQAGAGPSNPGKADPGPTAYEPQPPRFDVVRAEPGGLILVAGIAEPEVEISVLLDGVPEPYETTGTDGRFASFLDHPALDRPLVLGLRMRWDGREIDSLEEVIIAPAVSAAPEPDAMAGATGNTEPGAGNTSIATDAGSDAAGEAVAALPKVGAPKPAQAGTTAPAQSDGGAGSGGPTGIATPRLVEEVTPIEDTSLAPEPSQTKETNLTADAGSAEVEPADSAPALLAEVTTAPSLAPEPEPGPENAGASQGQPRSDTAPATSAPTGAAVTVLRSTAAGVEVMQPTVPVAQSQVAIDAITYDDEGDVALSGRGLSNATLRIYLDNTPITGSRIAADGRWRVMLPDVDGGTYTLRVDQLDGAGKVTSRAESPFLREDPARLVAASEAAEQAGGDEGIRAVTIQPGHTLWAIARDNYGDGISYVRIFEANKGQIRNPDLIYPGQIFDLPE